jgi:predicted NUDIX family phosphoesterase
MTNELVFGIDAKYVTGLHLNEPLSEIFNDKDYLSHVLKTGYFMNREEAEIDPSFKQVIPYVIFCNGDNDTFFSYTRAGTETRLHNLISVGVGGHINLEDFQNNPAETIFNNIYREIDEEVAIWADDDDRIFSPELNIIGPDMIIYQGVKNHKCWPFTTQDMLNSVHLGLVYLAFLPKGASMIMHEEGKEGKFRSFKELQEQSDNLEAWSKAVLPLLS